MNIIQASTTKRGYVVELIENDKGERRLEFQHRRVWREAYGEIPKGCHIHHINGNRTDNALGNLICYTPEEHYLIHHPLPELDDEDYVEETRHTKVGRTEEHRVWETHKGKTPTHSRANDHRGITRPTW